MLDILLILVVIMVIGYIHFLKVSNRHRYEELKFKLTNFFKR